jgi:hypothetical protein
MNTEPVDTIESGETLTLPEPDPDNITVLTRNLPNKPILPWNHYDSPWEEEEEEQTDQEADTLDQDPEILEANQEADTFAQDPEIPEAKAESLEEESDSAEAIVDSLDEMGDEPLVATADPVEETPTDELTG